MRRVEQPNIKFFGRESLIAASFSGNIVECGNITVAGSKPTKEHTADGPAVTKPTATATKVAEIHNSRAAGRVVTASDVHEVELTAVLDGQADHPDKEITLTCFQDPENLLK
jgi:hypothetical protein